MIACLPEQHTIAGPVVRLQTPLLQPLATMSPPPPCFCCRRADGPLLAAVRSGAWVLLDELNLAGQTVLEGLNAVLDHRAEVSGQMVAGLGGGLESAMPACNRAGGSWQLESASSPAALLTIFPLSFFPPALLVCCQVFIPELNQTFRCPSTFRVFGAQNPLQVRSRWRLPVCPPSAAPLPAHL